MSVSVLFTGMCAALFTAVHCRCIALFVGGALQPLSLEELLKKKKEEQELAAKVCCCSAAHSYMGTDVYGLFQLHPYRPAIVWRHNFVVYFSAAAAVWTCQRIARCASILCSVQLQ
jgi:hypothetical protein